MLCDRLGFFKYVFRVAYMCGTGPCANGSDVANVSYCVTEQDEQVCQAWRDCGNRSGVVISVGGVSGIIVPERLLAVGVGVFSIKGVTLGMRGERLTLILLDGGGGGSKQTAQRPIDEL